MGSEPLGGRRRRPVGHDLGGVDRHLHGDPRHLDRQRLAVEHRRQSRRVARPGDLDDHHLSGGQRHHHSDQRFPVACHRPQALFHDLDRAVHRLLAGVRARAESRLPDRRPRLPGCRRRRAGAGRAVDGHRQLPAAEARPGLCRLRPRRRRRADHRPDHRRLDHRHHLLALDLPAQRAGRHSRAVSRVDPDRRAPCPGPRARGTAEPRPQGRLYRLLPGGGRARRAADHARPRPDGRLVRQQPDRHDGDLCGARPRRHGRLGNAARRSDRAAAAPEGPESRDLDGDDDAARHARLRHDPDHPADAAAGLPLHRLSGGAGADDRRRRLDRHDAADRRADIEGRCPAADLPRLCHAGLRLLALQHLLHPEHLLGRHARPLLHVGGPAFPVHSRSTPWPMSAFRPATPTRPRPC